MNDTIKEGLIFNLANFNTSQKALLSIYPEIMGSKNMKINEIDSKINALTSNSFDLDLLQLIESNKEIFEKYNFYEFHFDYLIVNMIFTSSYSLFENFIIRTAELVDSSNKLVDLKGYLTIAKVRNYFEKIHKIESAKDNTKEWKAIIGFREIRNAIVHNQSKLKKNSFDHSKKSVGLIKLLEHNISFSEACLNFKINNISFIEDFRDTSTLFALNIYKELLNKN